MKAYIAGVLCSDGYLTARALGLTAKDRDFVEAFTDAVNKTYGRSCNVGPDGKYWRVLFSNKKGTFDDLKNYQPETKADRAAWLRGLFDGDGNASLIHLPRMSPGSYARRIGFYSTAEGLLLRAQNYLLLLGMHSILRKTKSSASHYGKKQMYELVLRGSKSNFSLFAKLVNSSINRKRAVIDAIPKSYQPPGHYKRMQALGVKTRILRRDSGGRY